MLVGPVDTGGGTTMIVRIWHGKTPRARGDGYSAFLHDRVLPDCRDASGNQEVIVLRRDEKEVSHFVIITRWESEGDIRDFTGGEILRAKYYPENKEFLLESEPEVEHFTVVGQAP
jgi:heme-degrading monooxygenase HmoA